jgi:predicted transcriptional regulator
MQKHIGFPHRFSSRNGGRSNNQTLERKKWERSPQSELVEATGYSKSTISYFLKKLEGEGVVYRRGAPASGSGCEVLW